MKFAVKKDFQSDVAIIKETELDGQSIDCWISEDNQNIKSSTHSCFDIRESREGVFGKVSVHLLLPIADNLLTETVRIYKNIFKFIESRPEMRLLRVWNYIPSINAETPHGGELSEMYHYFNKGRFEAYVAHFGEDKEKWSIPAASAVGVDGNILTVEFFAVFSVPVFLENKVQVPAIDYSKKYGPVPPLFTRGAIFDNQGQRLLITSGTAAIKGENSLHFDDPVRQFMEAIDNIRILISQFNLRLHEVEFGFGLEDLQLLRVYYRHEQDKEKLGALARKVIDPDCNLVMMQAEICRKELLVEIEGVFLKKGEYKGSQRKYEVIGNKIRVESFELHIVEHCNLRCHMCDAMSPYNPEKFLKLEDIATNMTFLAKHIKADIFKLMGGEPLLHPQIVDIISIVRESRITDTIRLTTNGLLLHKMPDDFWRGLDRLTVSNYSSSPMKEKHVRMAHEKARAFNVVLNLKYIDQFNGVMIKKPIDDKDRVQRIYDNCWVRHRSLVIRNGIFFKCTRAAYMDDFRREFGVCHHEDDPSSFNEGDGIKMDENFFVNALEYLNAESPLNSCRYCFGASGKLIPHRQMTKKEVADRYLDSGIFYTD